MMSQIFRISLILPIYGIILMSYCYIPIAEKNLVPLGHNFWRKENCGSLVPNFNSMWFGRFKGQICDFVTRVHKVQQKRKLKFPWTPSKCVATGDELFNCCGVFADEPFILGFQILRQILVAHTVHVRNPLAHEGIGHGVIPFFIQRMTYYLPLNLGVDSYGDNYNCWTSYFCFQLWHV